MPDGRNVSPRVTRSRSFNHVAGASIRRSSPSPFAAPRITSIVPSVTINGTTRSCVISTPLMRPHRAAVPMPPSAANSGLTSIRSNCAITTVTSAIIEPTDKIDPAGDDDDRHADCGDADNRHLPSHELEIGGGEELRPDQHPEDDRDQYQADERSGPLDERSGRHAAVPPVTAIIKSCSVSDSAGTASFSRPRCMTAMRSQSPSSSGR